MQPDDAGSSGLGAADVPGEVCRSSNRPQAVILPDLRQSLNVMEARKSMRRYRGTSESTQPVATALLFFFMVMVLLYIPSGSGVVTPSEPGYEVQASSLQGREGNNTVYLIATFGMSFNTLTRSPSPSEIALCITLVAIFFLLTWAVIAAQIYYRLTGGIWIVVAFTVTMIVYRSVSDIDDFSPGVVTAPVVYSIFIIFAIYVLAILFLWHKLPDLQQRKRWFMCTVLSEEPIPVPGVVSDAIDQVYRDSHSETWMGTGQGGLRIEYNGWFSSWLPRMAREHLRRTFIITYCGEVDADGKPHGYGEWNDTYYHGEVLEGWWLHGVPSGPFRSREYGSGAGFSRLLIPYVHDRTDAKPHRSNGKIAHAPLTLGIMEVECCVAGLFFREYPKADEYYRVQPGYRSVGDAISEVLQQLLPMPNSHDIGSLVVQADFLRGLLVSAHSAPAGTDNCVATISANSALDLASKIRQGGGLNINAMLSKSYTHRPRLQDGNVQDVEVGSYTVTRLGTDEGGAARAPFLNLLSQATLSIAGWELSTFWDNCEALVFVPGFNSTAAGTSKLVAQLLALGNFPSYIKVFIFSWPGGSLFKYFQAQTQGAESLQTEADLRDFVLGLRHAGLRKIHLMTHSMGVRVLTGALESLEEIFTIGPDDGRAADSNPSESKLELSTVTILNPEIGRNEFVDCYARRITELCPCVTLYVDALDTALFFAEAQNSLMRMLCPNRRQPSVSEDLSRAPAQKQRQRQRKKLLWEYSLGRIGKDLLQIKLLKLPQYADGGIVDIDVVQTTYLGANVQEIRHASFNLNREFIDDVRDLIVNKQRAYQRRARLQYRGGNRFNFLVAPSHIVNP